KYAAPIKGGGDEQIWIMVTALGSGTITGTLGNAPVADIGLKLGASVSIQPGDIKDWLFTDGQAMTGGFSIATLRNAAGKREQFTDGPSMTGGVSISTLKKGAGERDRNRTPAGGSSITAPRYSGHPSRGLPPVAHAQNGKRERRVEAPPGFE